MPARGWSHALWVARRRLMRSAGVSASQVFTALTGNPVDLDDDRSRMRAVQYVHRVFGYPASGERAAILAAVFGCTLEEVEIDDERDTQEAEGTPRP